MALYWRKKAILLKQETTYGTDAAPVAAQAVRAFDVTFTPIEAQAIDEESVQPFMGAGDTFIDQQLGRLEFSVHAAGSGEAGTAPAYGTALLIGGMGETVTADTQVDYTPVSAAFDSGTVHFNMDGQLHKFLGGRSNITFGLERGRSPYFRCAYTGLYAPVTAAALPTVDYSAFQRPVMPSKAATPTVTLHGFACKLKSLMIDLGQQVEPTFLVNDESVDITDRAATAKAVIQNPGVGAKDFFAAMNAQPPILGALALVHGTTAGAIVEVGAPKAQIVRIAHSVDKGIAYLDLDLSLKPDAGDDEVTFTVR
ncbi:phage tail tube protein [Azospirillum sp. A39]|uniref:phage tail tube protein n=1 Tax=Azospirillum sp. A39 TaxID=3462279 RepID=UPI0040452377